MIVAALCFPVDELIDGVIALCWLAAVFVLAVMCIGTRRRHDAWIMPAAALRSSRAVEDEDDQLPH